MSVRLFFWMILGAFSVFFAEVTAGSSPFPWIEAWGLFVTLPLYGLHALFLAWVVFSPGRRISLPTLFIAGALFGMYEAYITKVLFDPSWGSHGLAVGGLYLLQTLVLVLYWHPFMAFIVPLFFAEQLLAGSREILGLLPARPRSPTGTMVAGVCIAALAGLVLSLGAAANSASTLKAAESVLLSYVVLAVLVLTWRLAVGGTRWTLRELLPTRRQGLIIAGLLAALYLVLGTTLRSASLPRNLIPHATALAVYAFLIALLILNIRKASSAPAPAGQPERRNVSSVVMAIFMVVLLAATAALAPFKNADYIAVMITWIIGCIVGAFLLAFAVRRAVLPRAPGV